MRISVQKDHGRLDVFNEWLRRGCPQSFTRDYEGRVYRIEAGKLTIGGHSGCKFCHRLEPGCNSKNLILCSQCFRIVANSTQDQIKGAYELAVARGYTAKAKVLEKFILIGEMENGGEQINTWRTARHIAKHFDRGRGPKVDRPQKKPAGRQPEQEAPAVSQNQPELPVIS